mmetsp:Transcript_25565/g.100948  ORF Transcript_25565/g.100948 Transcript_25565/m.100948 type:complete len:222 (+) Transcript_25565:157-822(+)
MRVFPFTIDDLERNVLIGRPGNEAEDAYIRVVSLLDLETWCFRFVDQVRVENVKLVALNSFRRRVVVIVMRLVVLVPFVARVDPVEVFRLPRLVLIVPSILLIKVHFFVEFFLVLSHSLLRFTLDHLLFLLQLAHFGTTFHDGSFMPVSFFVIHKARIDLVYPSTSNVVLHPIQYDLPVLYVDLTTALKSFGYLRVHLLQRIHVFLFQKLFNFFPNGIIHT